MRNRWGELFIEIAGAAVGRAVPWVGAQSRGGTQVADQQGSGNAGGVGSAIAGVLGGGEQVQSFADGAKHYLAEAKSGHWAVDEETGTHLLNGIKQAQARVNDIRPRTGYLREAPMVGNDAYARKVAQHMVDSVDSDAQSLLPVLNAFYDGLASLQEAVETAIRNYDASDEAATKHLTAFQD